DGQNGLGTVSGLVIGLAQELIGLPIVGPLFHRRVEIMDRFLEIPVLEKFHARVEVILGRNGASKGRTKNEPEGKQDEGFGHVRPQPSGSPRKRPSWVG